MKITIALLALSLWLGSAQTASAEMKQITCVATGNTDKWVSQYETCTKDGFNSSHYFIIDTRTVQKTHHKRSTQWIVAQEQANLLRGCHSKFQQRL